MTLLARLKAQREQLLEHVNTLDELIARLNTLTTAAGHRETPRSAKPRNARGLKDRVAEAARAWSSSAAILRSVGGKDASVYATISSLAKTGVLERRGQAPSYEYRSRMAPMVAPVSRLFERAPRRRRRKAA